MKNKITMEQERINFQTKLLMRAVKLAQKTGATATETHKFLKDRDWPRIRQDNMSGLLIYGKRSDLSPNQESILQAMNYDRRASYQIKTFDDILTENEAFLDNLRKI